MSVALGLSENTGSVIRSWVAGACCFLIPMALVTAYTLNHFYVDGGYLWDSGLFAHFSAFTDEWPMLWPDLLPYDTSKPRPTFFSIHFMPILYGTSALYQLVPIVPPAAWFSILQGTWAGLIGLSAFLLCAAGAGIGVAAVTALATALCGPMLAAIGFPHIEMAIPGLLLLFFALRTHGRAAAAYVALGLCLLVREDAGLHAAAFLTMLACAQWISGRGRHKALHNLGIALACTIYSVAAVAFQMTWAPGDAMQLEDIYLGRPVGAHLSWQLISARAAMFLTGWGYAVWPVIVLLAVALWRRNVLLLAGALAPIPWILLSLLAVKENGLMAYYSFPLIIAIAWPTIAMPLSSFAVKLQLALASGSVLLFVLAGGPNHDRAPWRLFVLPDLGAVGRYEAALRGVVGRRHDLGRIMLDDAAVSLVPEALGLGEWALLWSASRLPDPDVVIHRPSGSGEFEARKVIEAAGLRHQCRIDGTPFVIFSRTGTSICR
jgi:hypothetical protein